MSGYVELGYSLTAVVLAGYSWRVLRRERLLRRQLPDEPVGARRRTR
jgi:hypothetical protein